MQKSLSKRARQIIEFAQQEAASHGIDHVEPPHLLLGLLHDDSRWPSANIAVHVLESKQVEIDPLRRDIEAQITQGSAAVVINAETLQPDERTRLVFDRADEEATRLGDMFIGCEHILLGLLCDEPMADLLHHITPEEVREAARA